MAVQQLVRSQPTCKQHRAVSPLWYKIGRGARPLLSWQRPFSMHKTWIMAAAQGRMNVCLVQAGLQHVCFLFCSCLVIVLLLHLQRGQALALAAAAECEAALALLHERAVLAGAERVLVEVLELGVRAREACAPRRYSSTDRSGLEQASQLAHAHPCPISYHRCRPNLSNVECNSMCASA